MLKSKRSSDDIRSARKRLWPWVVVLLLVVCAIYSYERVAEFLAVNAEQLPLMLFDFVIEYFLGEPMPPRVSEV